LVPSQVNIHPEVKDTTTARAAGTMSFVEPRRRGYYLDMRRRLRMDP
jgi:hypothetical protein